MNDKMWTEAFGEETESTCACCGRPVYEGQGVLASESAELAEYGYRWADGHESRYTLGICPLDEAGNLHIGLAVISARSDGESLIYTVLDPEDSPWGDSEEMGAVLSRKQLLEERVIPKLFELVDAIASREPRIYSRIIPDL
jgi:hypothetical protein